MNPIHKYILQTADTILTAIILILLCSVGLYCTYSLWDNQQIYIAAENIQNELLKLKPDAENPSPSFEELLNINPDVCAWLTIDNTNIDYPILQGKDNLTYINTDVYGNFALAGSIFLDSRCNRNFDNSYSLVYGHHMANNKMFGDLDLFKEKSFFDKNQNGTLYLPNDVYNLKIIACLITDAGDDVIFEPQKWAVDSDFVLEYAETHALYVNIDFFDSPINDRKLMALSTCSTEYEEARTIILAVLEPYKDK